ncbi:MAG: SatD family protein [Cellulophaga sp.]
MVAIITGDIINSDSYMESEWIGVLKQYLSKLGDSPVVWDIYRGDEFQVKVSVEKALHVVIGIKSCVKSIKGLDVRMGIGIGEESYTGSSVSQSNGTAYQRSGRVFESLKQKKLNLAIATDDTNYDDTINLILKLTLDFMNDWSVVSAEIVSLALENSEASQQEIAQELNIKQSAVSQRQKRARLDLLFELLEYYKRTLPN